ncbi:lithostathine-1-like [Homarus americanus]|uniref:lithostathine-1-like n=1 Tax=Homarus americanus TaxID=6706 RepID=UPI001C43ACEB|nr:lithostathine-1-like [Homarus americanus]
MRVLLLLLLVCLAAVICSARIENNDRQTPALVCDTGFVEIANNCYRFYQQRLSWSQAGQTCREVNSELASVITEAEYSGILNHLNTNFPGTYWTSGKVQSGRWIWSATGSQMASNWWGTSPSTSPNNCAYFCSNTLKYWAKSCNSHLRFICQNERVFQFPDVIAE